MGASWGRLGPSWARLGPSWSVLGASWAVLKASWILSRPVLATKTGKVTTGVHFLSQLDTIFTSFFITFLMSCLLLSCLSSSMSFFKKWCFAPIKHHFLITCLEGLHCLERQAGRKFRLTSPYTGLRSAYMQSCASIIKLASE